ncbi:MAG: Spo0E like sporulation regulatory protein [Clostridia bacterium]|jgi:hypothetical protein|nr:Spo0E like sporulation regulatory protein [Clostridia bacterium]
MSELEKLLSDIEKLRESLYKVIEQQGYDLNDSEVLKASKNLNTAIVNYNALIQDKIKE